MNPSRPLALCAVAALLLAPVALAQQRPLPPPPGPEPDWTAETFAAAHPEADARGGEAFTLTGAWPYGASYAVAVNGPYVHRAQGRVLETLEFPSGPGAPALLSSLVLPGVIRDVAAAPPHLYVGVTATGRAEDRGLFVVDVTDASAPAVVGSLTGAYVYGVALDGGYAYLAAFANGAALHVVDVSDPAAPTLAATQGLAGFSNGLDVGGGYAYVAGGSSGLHVVNVTVPTDPTPAMTLGLGGYVRRVALGEVGGTAHAAAAVGSYTSSGYVSLLDLGDPAAPVLVGNGPDEGFPVEDVAWSGSVVYAAESYNGVATYGASTAGLTFLSRSYNTPANIVPGANRVAVAGGRLHVADYYYGLLTFDTSAPADPVYLGTLDGQSFAYGVAVDTADPSVGWLAAGSYGLVRLDLADPSGPAEAARVHDPGWNYSYDVAQTATHVYVADGYSGVWVVEKASGTVTANLPLGFADELQVSGDGSLLFAIDGLDAVAYSLATPADPPFAARVPELDAFELASTGRTLYVGTETGAVLHVVDFSSPSSPVVVRSIDEAGTSVELACDGDRLYAYVGPRVFVYDLATPLDPQRIATVSVPDRSDAQADGSVLYLADGVLSAYDFADPNAPVLLGLYAGFASASPLEMAFGEDVVYVAAGNAGVYRLRSDLSVAGEPGPVPGALAASVAPNPARDRAALRLALPEAADVRAEVFDVTGRRVRVLEDGPIGAGTHDLALDAGGLPPGVYLLRVRAGDHTATRRLTLVR